MDFVTWLVLAGALVLLVALVVRRAAKAPEARREPPTLFKESTMLDDPADRDKPR